jgi:hypothetical protein
MIRSKHLFVVTLLGILSACGQSADQQPGKVSAATAAPAMHGAAVVSALATEPLPLVTVYKSPSCGCCGLWVDHVKQAGFPVSVVGMDNLNPLKLEMGVPADGGSCHTAVVGGYFIEGHVPAADVQRLLAEQPAARGLTVPGMVMGSPGMEVASGSVQPYTVYLVDLNGNSTPYSHHDR